MDSTQINNSNTLEALDCISRQAAIDALDESIKHFDDMAEECRRNANIERNDYMDMRDDAAEYRQLSIWLNELKWLRERFQSRLKQRWIPVTERLPEDGQNVLVTYKTTDKIHLCQYHDDGSRNPWYSYIDQCRAYMNTVLAWMPIPEPWKGESNG